MEHQNTILWRNPMGCWPTPSAAARPILPSALPSDPASALPSDDRPICRPMPSAPVRPINPSGRRGPSDMGTRRGPSDQVTRSCAPARPIGGSKRTGGHRPSDETVRTHAVRWRSDLGRPISHGVRCTLRPP